MILWVDICDMGEQRECRCVEIEVGELQAHKERWKWRGAYTYVREQGCIFTYVYMSGYRSAYLQMYRDRDV